MTNLLPWLRYYEDLKAEHEQSILLLLDRVEHIEARLAELEKSQRNERDDGR